jgi:alkaline phosphatase D
MVSFRTAAEDKGQSRSFVFGSCRYLLRLFGGSWFDNRGDKTFRSILRQMDQGAQTDILLMLGDQIYADDMNFIDPDQSVDEYNARYREAFSQPYIRSLMSQVPTYMIMDDHEIEDNWPSKATYKDWVVKYPAAMHAYQTYQGSHNPVLPMVEDNKMAGVPESFWYKFQDGCCDFFVTDVRTERHLADDPDERRIMNDRQMAALKEWLADGSDMVKFVVSSVAFVPDPSPPQDSEDMWGGFPQQRGEILDLIRDEGIQKVVFLGGDYHFSMKSELASAGKPDFRVLSVISSAFFWPYPHGSWRSFQDSGQLTAVSPHTYEVVNSSQRFGTDNFTRISVDLQKLRIQIFSRKGDPLYDSEYVF